MTGRNCCFCAAIMGAALVRAAALGQPGADVMLPENLRSGLVFWVDANTNIIETQDGAVDIWADVRESFVPDEDMAAHNWKYIHAGNIVTNAGFSSVPPTFCTEASRFPGKRFVDFGEYESGKWLLWKDGAGVRTQQIVRAYFCVVGFGNTCGHLLSDVAPGNLGTGRGGTVFFHKGSGGSGDGAISTSTADSCLYYGETRLNGTRVNPTVTTYLFNDYQLFEQNGPYNAVKGTETRAPFASDFMNDRNFKKADGFNDRQGGARIGEMLIYDRVLSDRERRRVAAYLNEKWFGITTPDACVVGDGETLVVTNETACIMTDLKGPGAVIKQGKGPLTLGRNGGLLTGPLYMEAGSLRFTENSLAPAFGLIPGTRLTVGDASISAVPDTHADTVSIVVNTSDTCSSIRLSGLSNAVKTLSLSGGETVIQAPAALTNVYQWVDPFLLTGDRITNGSFESPAASSWQQGNEMDGWTIVTPAVGTTRVNTPWLTSDITVPDGLQACYLQRNSSVQGRIQQTVHIPADGLYKLSFRFTKRTTKANARLGIYLDGVLVYSKMNEARKAVASETDETAIPNTVFQKFGVFLPMSVGEHVLAFEVMPENSTDDRAIVIDDVRLEPSAPGNYVYVENAGFDSLSYIGGNAGFQGFTSGSPTGAGWSYSADKFIKVTGVTTNVTQEIGTITDNGLTTNWVTVTTVTTNVFSGDQGAGITQYPSTWYAMTSAATEDNDFRVAFIQREASFSNTVTFPKTGRIRFSMRYANRSNRALGSGEIRNAGHRCFVTLNGAEIGVVAPATQEMQVYQSEFEIEAGTYMLAFKGWTPDVNDYATILDDIRFRYVTNDGVGFQDEDFMRPIGEIWHAVGSQKAPTRMQRVTGTYSVGLRKDAGIEQTFTVPSNGVYVLSVSLRGRSQALTSVNGVYNNYKYYPHVTRLTVDGKLLTTFTADSPDGAVFQIRLPWLTADTVHTFRLQGDAAVSPAESETNLWDVRITPLATRSVSTAFNLSDTALTLTDSAVLRLDSPDELVVRSVRYAGLSYFGSLSAANCAFIAGVGSLKVVPAGSVIILR